MATATERFRFRRDLGELDGPLAVFGGPLSNLEALDALLKAARARGIPDAHMICTGDVAGYGADPEPCLAALRERGIATVMGNVEEALAADAADCGCNFVAGSTCDALAGDWYGYARARVSLESRAWMAGLPRIITFRFAGHVFTTTHGGLRRINRYLFASNTDAIAEELATLDADGAVLAGHAGIPFTVTAGWSLWHNAGALGLPANDGTPRVWFSVISAEGDRAVRFEPIALDYDHGAAAAKMRRTGLPDAYARALATGLWPDTAILPEREAWSSGVALTPAPFIWC